MSGSRWLVGRIVGAFGLVCLAALSLFAVGEAMAVCHTFLDKYLFTPRAEAARASRFDAIGDTLAKHPGITRITLGTGAEAIIIQLAPRPIFSDR